MHTLAPIDDYGITDVSIGHVDLRAIPGGNLWRVIQGITVRWTDRDGKQSFIIPEFMETDLASVPQIFCNLIVPCGRIKESAVMHDGMYQYRPLLLNGDRIGRARADYLLYTACMQIGGMSHEEAWMVYTAVRIGGSSVWHAHDTEFLVSSNIVVA